MIHSLHTGLEKNFGEKDNLQFITMHVVTVSPAPRDNRIRCGNNIENKKEDHDPSLGIHQEFDKDDELIYGSLRPMLITMKVFGLYCLDKTSFTRTLHCKVLLGYSVIVLMLLWGNILINLPGVGLYKTLDDAIVNGSIYIWKLHCCCNASALFVICIRSTGWKHFFIVQGLTEKFKTEGCKSFKTRVWIYVTITWLAMIINISFQVYGVFSSKTFNFYMLTLGKNSLQVILLKCVQSVTFVFLTAVYVIPTMLTILISDLLSLKFQSFNAALLESLGKCPFNLCKTIVSHRNEHQRLTDLTLAADTLLSGTIGMTIIFNIMMFCGTMYGVIHNLHEFTDALVTMTIILWLALALIQLFVTIGTCNSVNDQVRN